MLKILVRARAQNLLVMTKALEKQNLSIKYPASGVRDPILLQPGFPQRVKEEVSVCLVFVGLCLGESGERESRLYP